MQNHLVGRITGLFFFLVYTNVLCTFFFLLKKATLEPLWWSDG